MTESRLTESVNPDEARGARPELLRDGLLFADRFVIVRFLGRGGSGLVYEAHDRQLDRRVALKILRSDRLSEKSLRRFRREVAIARDVQHAHLLRIFDVAENDGGAYLTMELVEGETLRERIRRLPLTLEECRQFSVQLLEALAALHKVGIVHRDIKPGNIIVAADGILKLGDFGLATTLGRDETTATENPTLLGTLEYLSPEQALGKSIDARSDLYSFGVVLFEMLTGRLPYERSSSLGMVIAHLHDLAADPRSIRPDIPKWLCQVVNRLLAKSTADRYGSAEQVLVDLKRRKAALRVPSRTRRWALAIAVLVLMAAAVMLVFRDRAGPIRLVSDGGTGTRALDQSGKTLWTKTMVQPEVLAAPVRVLGRVRMFAAVAVPALDPEDPRMRVLTLIDARSGRTVETVNLPDAGYAFADYANRFSLERVRTFDLDHDGNDEVFVSYSHVPYWPSYTVMYSPALKMSRMVLIASGHHRIVGATDINGDGRDDLLFFGPNNKMGWYAGMAAVDVPLDGDAKRIGPASTPDATYAASFRQTMLWYSLVARFTTKIRFDSASIDTKARKISLSRADGPPTVVGFNGFLEGRSKDQSSPERSSERVLAYEMLREGSRLAAQNVFDEAIASLDRAFAAASTANDRNLGDWVRRVRAKILARSGRLPEAEREFADLVRSSNTASDIAFEAATEMHLAGALREAVGWYRQGLGRGGENDAGRFKYEFLIGVALALGELNDWNAALEEARRFAASYPTSIDAPIVRDYVLWRTGRSPMLQYRVGDATTDLYRYWDLEFRSQTEDPSEMLESVRRERARTGMQGPLLSLEAELLARSGKRAEAAAAIGQAVVMTRSEAREDYVTRAHLPVVEDRFRRLGIARKTG